MSHAHYDDVVWTPQEGQQTHLLTCPYTEIFYGGAAGGGKSDGLLGHFLRHYQEEDARGISVAGILFRKEAPQLEDLIERSKEIYTHVGATYFEKKAMWRFPNGSWLRMRALERDSDYNKYIGHAYTWQGWDEVPTWADVTPIDKMKSRLRSAKGAKTWWLGTGNPGGPGHGWVKQRFIDPAPDGMTPIPVVLPNGETHYRIFIPAKVSDNKILMENDPGYVNQLYMVGKEELVKAWLEGDWNVALGQFFSEWNEPAHVIPNAIIPSHWFKYRALDWGSVTPFCVLWLAVSDGITPLATPNGSLVLPWGALVVYREWYGHLPTGHNVGLKMTGGEVADGILQRETEIVQDGVADTQIFRTDNGPSIYEGMALKGVYFRAANKDRIPGWNQVRVRLKGENYGEENWRPMVYIMEQAEHLIRTLPNMVHDEKNQEDVLKVPEDHAPETLRYGCMARPWQPVPPKHVRKVQGYTLQQLFDAEPAPKKPRLPST